MLSKNYVAEKWGMISGLYNLPYHYQWDEVVCLLFESVFKLEESPIKRALFIPRDGYDRL